MSRQGVVGDRFRVELETERKRKGWSREYLAGLLNDRYAISVHPSAIAKIEYGQRDVRVDELVAFAELFGAPIDALLGLHSGGTDVMWAASKLSTNAQKAAADLARIRKQVSEDAQDLHRYAERDRKLGSMQPLVDAAIRVCAAVENAQARIADLATEWPLPGVNLDRA